MNVTSIGINIGDLSEIQSSATLKTSKSEDEIAQIANDLNITKIAIDNTDEDATLSTEKNDTVITKQDEKPESETIAEDIKEEQTALDNIKNTLDEKKKEYKKLEEEIEEKNLELNKAVKEAEEKGETNSIKVSTLEVDLKFLKSKFSVVQTDIETLTKDYNSKNDTIKELQTKYETAKAKEKKKAEETKSTTNTNISNNTNNANNNTSDGTDWTKLTVDGKGINIGNLAKVLADASKKCGSKSASQVVDYIEKHGTEEERNAVVQLFSALDDDLLNNDNSVFKSQGTSSPAMSMLFGFFDDGNKEDVLGNNLSSVVDNIAQLAQYDKDGDGFISDTEIKNMTTFSNNLENLESGKTNTLDSTNLLSTTWMHFMTGVNEDGSTGGCGSPYKFENAWKTTINGQTVYTIQSGDGSTSLVLTEKEMDALDKYYKEKGDKADYKGAIEAIGGKITNDDGSVEFENSLGITCHINAFDIQSSHVKKSLQNSNSIDTLLWTALKGIQQKNWI